jgi:putative ABC transport system permease protein
VDAYPRVYAGPERGVVESPDVADGREFVIAVSSVFGGATLLIAILVIAGTVGLSVKQRHRDIALLRAIAATPRQVRRLVIREAVVLGLLASITGVWALGESSVERPGIGVIRALLGAVTRPAASCCRLWP